MGASPSSPAAVRIGRKARENAALFAGYAVGRQKRSDLDAVFEAIEEYDGLARALLGRPLESVRLLEIGFGARPLRMRALLARGVDARGVDVEVPLLRASLAEVARIRRTNGVERALKSAVRFALFDRRERRGLERRLRERGESIEFDRSRLIVANAADLDLEPGALELIVSEDVFEHIDRASLQTLLPAMHRWLVPGGIALIRPNVFTGITGGHQNEWGRWSFEAAVEPQRRSPAWDHLLDREHPPNSYLNELWRAAYRELFEPFFEVVEERVKLPGLGRSHLDGEIAERLLAQGIDQEELFSNQILFVLRRREAA